MESPLPRSPIPHLLHTNLPPTELEISNIQRFITQANTKISQHDLRISKLSALLDGLRREREDLISNICDHEVHLRSPIRKLAPELLVEVLKHCVPRLFDFSLPGLGRCTLLQAVGVCRHWRDIMLSTPTLWAAAPLSFSLSKALQHRDGRYKMAKLWLERTGASPLSMVINGPIARGIDIGPVFNMFSTSAARWQSLDLVASAVTFQALSSVTDGFPRLGTLSLSRNSADGGESISSLGLFDNAPRLHHLRIYGLITSKFCLPWRQLTELETIYPTIEDALLVLAECPNLYSFSAFISPSDAPAPPLVLGMKIQCNQLRRLYLVLEHDRMLDLITAPALLDIRLNFVGHSNTWNPRVFTELITRSSCSLEILILRGIFLDDAQLIQCLETSPSLMELRVHLNLANTSGRCAISRLTKVDSLGRQICPELRIIDFIIFSFCCPVASIVNMIQSRYNLLKDAEVHSSYVAPLLSVTLEIRGIVDRRPADEECFEVLRQSRDRGLDISVKIGSRILQFDDPVSQMRYLSISPPFLVYSSNT